MSLITKNQLELVIQAFKNLLSFKADKTEVEEVKDLFKEVTSEDAMFLAIEMNFINPVVNKQGLIFTDNNGVIYSL